MKKYQEHSEASQKEAEGKSWKITALTFLHDLAYMIVGILLLFLLCFRMVVVSGFSMYPGLTEGDYLLLASNFLYPHPKTGDVIVASKESFDHGAAIIKRVIATEGQTVDIDFEAGIVYVDGKALEEDYVNTPTNLDEGTAFPLTVEKGCVFAMGDNRNNSKDSRSLEIGQIDEREILGRALFLVLPGENRETEQRDYSRIGAVK